MVVMTSTMMVTSSSFSLEPSHVVRPAKANPDLVERHGVPDPRVVAPGKHYRRRGRSGLAATVSLFIFNTTTTARSRPGAVDAGRPASATARPPTIGPAVVVVVGVLKLLDQHRRVRLSTNHPPQEPVDAHRFDSFHAALQNSFEFGRRQPPNVRLNASTPMVPHFFEHDHPGAVQRHHAGQRPKSVGKSHVWNQVDAVPRTVDELEHRPTNSRSAGAARITNAQRCRD